MIIIGFIIVMAFIYLVSKKDVSEFRGCQCMHRGYCPCLQGGSCPCMQMGRNCPFCQYSRRLHQMQSANRPRICERLHIPRRQRRIRERSCTPIDERKNMIQTTGFPCGNVRAVGMGMAGCPGIDTQSNAGAGAFLISNKCLAKSFM